MQSIFTIIPLFRMSNKTMTSLTQSWQIIPLFRQIKLCRHCLNLGISVVFFDCFISLLIKKIGATPKRFGTPAGLK